MISVACISEYMISSCNRVPASSQWRCYRALLGLSYSSTAVVTAADSAGSSDDRVDGALAKSEPCSLAGTCSDTAGVSSGPLVGPLTAV